MLHTREPGGSPGAERLRALLLDRDLAWSPLAETLLHVAARAEHVERTIRPALAAGTWVVCDRFANSTMAYQGYGQGIDRATIATLGELPGIVPDVTFVLDVSPPVAAERLASRGVGADRYEAMDAAFHARVTAGFRAIAGAEPARCVLIDADAAEPAVHAAIMAALVKRLAELDVHTKQRTPQFEPPSRADRRPSGRG